MEEPIVDILEAINRDMQILEAALEGKERLLQAKEIRIHALLRDVQMWRERAERAESENLQTFHRTSTSNQALNQALREPDAIRSDSPGSQVPEK